MKSSTLLICLLLSTAGAIAGGAGASVLILSGQVFLFEPHKALDLAGNAMAGGLFGAFLVFIAMLAIIPVKRLRTDEYSLAYWLARLTSTTGLLIALAGGFGEKEEIFSGHANAVLGRMALIVALSASASLCQYAVAWLGLRYSAFKH